MDEKMKNTAAKVLPGIAQEFLGLDTLETRNSDSLDFHELSAWEIKNALEAAFLAGAIHGSALAPGKWQATNKGGE